MQGWVKLHRNVMESETFSKLNAIQQLIAIYIILNANHEDGVWIDKYKNVEVPVKRGQLITSRNKIVNEWFKGDKDVTEQKVRTTLTKLVKLSFLTMEPTKGYTLLTVLNYNVYQRKEKETNQPTNQELTKQQPSINQALTTNKNDNNVLNDKEIKPINNNGTEKIMEFWDKNGFGLANISAKNKLLMFLDEGLTEDVILKALEVASEMNKTSYAYVEKVLLNWSKRGVKSVTDVEALQKEFELSKQKPKQAYNKKPIRTELLPAYMDETKKQPEPPKCNDDELAAKKRAIEEKLKIFRGG